MSNNKPEQQTGRRDGHLNSRGLDSGACMKTQFTLVGLLSVSLIYPMQAFAGHPGGGGGGGHAPAAAPHLSAPAPHLSAPAPHFQTPHAAAAPRIEAAHMSAPAQHFQAPHAMQQNAHFEAPHAMQEVPRAESRALEPHQAQRNGFAQPHMAEHENQAHLTESHTNGGIESRARGEDGIENGRNLSRAESPVENRAGLHGNKAEAHLQGRPENLQSANRMERPEAGGRNPAGEFGGREGGRPIANAGRIGAEANHAQNFIGRNRALGAAGGLAAGGLAAAALSHGGGHNEGSLGAGRESGRIPGPPSYANPRHSLAPEVGRALPMSPHAAPNLTYGNGARDIPHIGDARSGRPGAIDPGGYIRNAHEASPNINPAYARQQLAYANNNYQQAAAFNARNIMGNRGAWPWHLPNYSAPWFGGWQGNWNWEPNWYSGGGWNPGWGNGWNNGGGFLGFLSVLSPWGSNSELGWIPSLNYYNSYGWNGQNYPCDYYAANGFCPTPYVFNVGNGQFWNVGNGYTDYLPADYHAPITVAVQESVPNYSPDGQILGYQLQNFYYNAYWDPQVQNYGYYDYKQQFHWLTFPWNNAWNGAI
jgi:hypothetical protein